MTASAARLFALTAPNNLVDSSKATLEADRPKKAPKDSPHRAIYDAQHTEDQSALPGELKRSEGEPKNKDKVVNEAYDQVGAVLEFYKEKFHWNSIDNKGSNVASSVHFGESYENACTFFFALMPCCQG